MAKNSMNKWANFNKDADNRLIERQAERFNMSPDAFVSSQGHGATPYRPESIDYFNNTSPSAPAPAVQLDPEGVSEEVDPREFARTFNPQDADQVSQFQRLIGLKDDGIFGPKTLAALRGVQGIEPAVQEVEPTKDRFGYNTFIDDVKDASHYGPHETSSWDNLKEDVRNAFRIGNK